MAQVVNVSPVQIEDDGSSQRFLSVINTQIESRRKQEEALRLARLRQIEDNNKIFGNALMNADKFAAIDGVSPDAINEVISGYLQGLSKAQKAGGDNMALNVASVIADASIKYNGLKGFKPQLEEAIDELGTMFPSLSKQNIAALANRYFYEEQKLPDGSVRAGVNWNNLPRIKQLVKGEVVSNPERYIDMAGVINNAFQSISKIKESDYNPSVRLDPSSNKNVSVKVDGKIKDYETVIDVKEPKTGITVKVPGIKLTEIDGSYNPLTGGKYKSVDESTFNSIINNAQDLRQSIPFLSINAMNDHNTGVIYEYLKKNNPNKLPDSELIEAARNKAIGINESSMETPVAKGGVSDIPGIVNKYLPSNLELFGRVGVTKLLSDSGRYNPDGTLKSATVSPSVDLQKPGGITINTGAGTTPPPIQGWANVVRGLGGGEKPLGQVVGAIEAEPFVRFANDNAKMPSMLGMKYSPDAIRLRFNNDNTVTVIAGTQEIPTKISQRDYEIMLNERFSKKDETNAATYNYNNQGGPMPTVVPRTPTLRPGNPR